MKLDNCNNPVAQVVKTLTDRFEKDNHAVICKFE